MEDFASASLSGYMIPINGATNEHFEGSNEDIRREEVNNLELKQNEKQSADFDKLFTVYSKNQEHPVSPEPCVLVNPSKDSGKQSAAPKLKPNWKKWKINNIFGSKQYVKESNIFAEALLVKEVDQNKDVVFASGGSSVNVNQHMDGIQNSTSSNMVFGMKDNADNDQTSVTVSQSTSSPTTNISNPSRSDDKNPKPPQKNKVSRLWKRIKMFFTI